MILSNTFDEAAYNQSDSPNTDASKTGDTEAADTIQLSGKDLFQIERQPGLLAYFRSIWPARFFIFAHARSAAFSTGRGTFLGKLWLVLDPMLQVLIYAIVFGLVLRTHRGIDNFVGFLTIGVIYFRFLTEGLTNGSGLIQRNRSLITSFNFPRIAVPLGVSIQSFLDGLIPALVAVVIALALQLHKPISWSILWVPFLYLLIRVGGAGATMITARLTARIPDMRSVVRVITQGLFFISGVFYSLERFGDSPVATIMRLNPLYQFLFAIRSCVLEGQAPPLDTILYVSAWSVLLLIFGIVFFWRDEARYARIK